MRNEILFSDAEIEAHFDENSVYGGCIEEVSFTRDTLADFISANRGYALSGQVEREEFGGFSALTIEGLRVLPGQPRRSIVVIDYGAVRAVMG